ncbi:hypothetical protein V7S43_001161 [Phytophthora oleae]|uniref:Uncharacterized protein n=1 Tax=Phytophthora oleae TaxID=2107226 RepID=A0ABD3G623_9STRA
MYASCTSESARLTTWGGSPRSSLRQLASQDSTSNQLSAADSEPLVRVKLDSILLEVHHYRPLGKCDDVWNVAHVLSTTTWTHLSCAPGS